MVSLDDLGIEWVTKLREVARVGPATYVYRRITSFVIGAVVGFALNLGKVLRGSFDAVEDGLSFAGESASSAFGGAGSSVLDVAELIGETAGSIAAAAGPFAPLIGLALAVVLAAVAVRVLRAGLDNIPVVGTIKRLLLG